MDNFKRQFKQGDDYCDIRADYRSLISIGKSVEETEDLLLRAYCPKEGDLLFTPTFWLSLGTVSYTHLIAYLSVPEALISARY